MRPSQARFVTACQQLLALGAVIAVLIPASSVVSLDVVITQPRAQAPAQGQGTAQATGPGPAQEQSKDPGAGAITDAEPAAAAAADEPEALVETEAVEPEVTEVDMTATSSAAARTAPGAKAAPQQGRTELRSGTEPVQGYGAVGVTWDPQAHLEEDDITVEVRTRTDDEWSKWTELEYHDEHGPDPGSAEAKGIRPGTDPLLVGKVDDVEARAVTADGIAKPADMKLAVIAPGEGTHREVEEPEIDTASLGGASGGAEGSGQEADASQEPVDLETSDGDIELQAGSFTPRPQIFSRAQWGANENLRDKSSLRYHEVHAGFVHHTVNSNNYTRAEVPAIIRSIYAYHTQSRGWSDVGYNFLVDKFGRIWEGRAGGVDRPVVGAHTLGYNDYSFAMSAIGNFDIAQPPAAVLNAYGKLFAWKLSLHGVDAASTSQRVGSRTFKAINGHRDAGSTACPGRYLYAKLGVIRNKATNLQSDWTGRDRSTSVAGSAYPDVLVRRASDKRGFILPTEGMLRWQAPKTFGGFGPAYDAVSVTPDVTGDGKADVLVRFARTGETGIRPGKGNGQFGAAIAKSKQMAGLDQITAVGDLDADKRNDFVARDKTANRLYLFSGANNGTFRKSLLGTAWKAYNMVIAGGDLDGDGNNDVLGRGPAGALWLHPGDGNGKLKARRKLAGNWKQYDAIVGNADFTKDGKADLYARVASTQVGLVFPGKGNGTFGHWLGKFGRTQGATHLAAANVVGTADPDLVGVRNKLLTTVPHNGTQNTSAMRMLNAARFSTADLLLNVGDWDRDGYNDMVHRNVGNRNLMLHRGRADGTFAPAKVLGKGWGNVNLIAAVGDTTGDGYPDLMGQPSGGAMRIYPGNGSGLKASYVARSAISASAQLGLGRWNGDGAPDNLFRVGNTIRWYGGNGPGGLTGSLGTLKGNLAPYDWVISAGDIDRDGRPDLIVRGKAGGLLWLLPGTAQGFGAPKFLAEGFGGYDLAG